MRPVLAELPFDQYQRYGALALLADALRDRLGRRLRVLDVGDWNGLAARFCPDDECTCLDPDGRGQGRYVQADGRALPFADAAFDVVACLDALEHVPRPERPRIAAELRRVADHAVVVAVPVADGGAAEHEAALEQFVRDVLGGEQRQLREHREQGLPAAAEARAWLAGGEWRCADAPSGLLADWLPMMLAKHALIGVPGSEGVHRALDRRYNERHGQVDPAEPGYRHVVWAARGADAELPDALRASLGRPRREGDAEDSAVAGQLLVGALAARAGASVDLAALLRPDPAALARAAAALDARNRRLAGERAVALARVHAYESGRFIRAMALLARLRHALARR
jgi:SAM-dependent methyltransferase